ncbi:MAG: hypothetical protein RDV48_17225 [Candidatus Eremiobacteraeota bacterium]|nr:hypothetical protein [Candidatus Eremiobacteraeota bacterium]
MDSKPIISGFTPLQGAPPLQGISPQKTLPAIEPLHEETSQAPGDSVDIKLPSAKAEKTEKREKPAAKEVKAEAPRAPVPSPYEVLSSLSLPATQNAVVAGSAANPTSIALFDEFSDVSSKDAPLVARLSQELAAQPGLALTIEKYLGDSSHPMNIVASLRDPERREAVIAELKDMASKKPLSSEELRTEVDRHFDPSRPLMRSNDAEFNIDTASGQKKSELLKEKLLARDSLLYSTGDKPSPEQFSALDEHAGRLRKDIMPALVRELNAVVEGMPREQGYPDINARAKRADGIVDKIHRMREGNDGKAPRPDYCLADMPDAVGGRITVRTPQQLEQVMVRLEERFGKENIHEKDSFYSNPKKKYSPYRVLTYTVTVDGVPCEVQLTTLKASLAADLWHNTGYKNLHPDLPRSVLDSLSGMQRAVAAEEHRQICST